MMGSRSDKRRKLSFENPIVSPKSSNVLESPKSSKLSIVNPQSLTLNSVCSAREMRRQHSTNFPGSTFFPVPISPRLSPRAGDLPPVTPTKFKTSGALSPAGPTQFHGSEPIRWSAASKGKGKSKVHELTIAGDEDSLQLFIQSGGVNINEADEGGATPLILAGTHPDELVGLACLKVLMESGADPRVGDGDGFTALHWAAAFDRADAIRFLIQSGTPVHLVSVNGDTSLHRASRFGSMNAVTVLLSEFKANPHIRNGGGETVLEVAGKRGYSTRLEQNRIREALFAADPTLRTLILHHDDCSEHCSASAHQEAPERIEAILSQIRNSELLKGCIHVSSNFPPASREVLLMAHDEQYVDMVLALHEKIGETGSPVPFTPRVQAMKGHDKIKEENGCDTFFSAGSFPAAIRAVGAVCNAVDRVVQGFARNAFCCVRPPGHHAGVAGLLKNAVSCGFCIFNNVAIGAMHALDKYPDTVRKVAIVDFDVHHGNGTEEVISTKIKRPDQILFFSVHLYDKQDGVDVGSGEFYPGSGKQDMPAMNILNAPMVPAWRFAASRNTRVSRQPTEEIRGRAAFRENISNKLIPALDEFKPDIIFISAGFDAAKNDIGCGKTTNGKYCSGIDLNADDYRWATQQLQQVAQVHCNGRIVSVLEGGYGQWSSVRSETGNKHFVLNRENLGKNACAHVEGMVM